MNILVLGNGFDLAHGLPTKYTDFLEFVKIFEECYQEGIEGIRFIKVHSDIERWIRQLFDLKCSDSYLMGKYAKKLIDELHNLIKGNFWIDYFLQNPMYQKENWIDFESEISKVIESLDSDMVGDSESLDDICARCSNEFLNSRYCETVVNHRSRLSTYREIRDKLLCDINKLTKALELYLTKFVSKIEYTIELSDIRGIYEKRNELGEIESFINTKILNFNYTDTYSKVYKKNFDIDYIHGKADIDSEMDKCNMVLGIDEYLSDDRKDKDTEFIAFKKFYQRIFKGTGSKYKEWVSKIREDAKNTKSMLKDQYPIQIPFAKFRYKHSLYIFGHSLDVTDRDILRDLILNDNVYTTIFYHNREELGRKIANLVKVIGQDELIRRTGGNTKTIEFKQQRDMVPIKG